MRRKYIVSWKKPLGSVNKENRQNLKKRSSAYVIAWLPLLDSKIFLSKSLLSNKIHKSISSEGKKQVHFPGG